MWRDVPERYGRVLALLDGYQSPRPHPVPTGIGVANTTISAAPRIRL
jgi:hypothetical protein